MQIPKSILLFLSSVHFRKGCGKGAKGYYVAFYPVYGWCYKDEEKLYIVIAKRIVQDTLNVLTRNQFL
jgi:hypothetical protein